MKKLSDEKVQTIQKRYLEGVEVGDIARALGVSPKTVGNHCRTLPKPDLAMSRGTGLARARPRSPKENGL